MCQRYANLFRVWYMLFKFQDVNDTETHFQTLGRAVVALFATAFEVYEGLDDRGWANYHLVETFNETLEYALLPN